MSQIETIMLVALGFVLATLVALFIGRGMWAYAVRASKRRGERDRPSDLARVLADRDQLRAEYAMLSRKLELRLSDLKTRLAEQTAEISRNRNRIERLLAEIDGRDAAVTSANADLEETRAQLEPLEAELAHRTQSLQKLKEQLRDRDETITGLHGELAEAHAVIASHDRQIDALRATPADLEFAPASDDAEEAASAYERLSRRIEDLTLLSQRIETQRANLNNQHQAVKALKTDIVVPPKRRRSRRKKTAASSQQMVAKSAVADAGKAGQTVSAEQLEMQILEAERETAGLSQELVELDRMWNEKLTALGEVAPAKAVRAGGDRVIHDVEPVRTDAKRSGNGAHAQPDDQTNVISLASRIRALQKNITD